MGTVKEDSKLCRIKHQDGKSRIKYSWLKNMGGAVGWPLVHKIMLKLQLIYFTLWESLASRYERNVYFNQEPSWELTQPWCEYPLKWAITSWGWDKG